MRKEKQLGLFLYLGGCIAFPKQIHYSPAVEKAKELHVAVA
jgi:hypothetical protein